MKIKKPKKPKRKKVFNQEKDADELMAIFTPEELYEATARTIVEEIKRSKTIDEYAKLTNKLTRYIAEAHAADPTVPDLNDLVNGRSQADNIRVANDLYQEIHNLKHKLGIGG